MLQLGFRQRGRQRRRVEGEREQRNGETRNENEKDKEEKKVGPTEKKNNIQFTIGEQCGLKYEIALFINCKNYTI